MQTSFDGRADNKRHLTQDLDTWSGPYRHTSLPHRGLGNQYQTSRHRGVDLSQDTQYDDLIGRQAGWDQTVADLESWQEHIHKENMLD